MRKVGVVIFSLLIFPSFSFAACERAGFTVIYVNGILTSKDSAENDAKSLSYILKDHYAGERLSVLPGYNASHLAGYGDFLQSISQGLGFSLDDFDLVTILNQIAPEVGTQKILLVGHSQGTFYTNQMYDYLIKSGVPADSIAVYNLATPASFVAGGGKYLTSTNDKVINKVRDTDAQFHAALALSGNVTYPKESGYETNDWGGHSLSAVYLANGASRIVNDIQTELSQLKADPEATSTRCFIPPSEGLAYKIQSAAFSVADPIAGPANTYVIRPKVDLALQATAATKTGLATLSDFNAKANVALNAAIGSAFFSIFPRPDAQSASVAFAVEKGLYGSSLSVDEYKALLNGENPYETPQQTTATAQKATIPPDESEIDPPSTASDSVVPSAATTPTPAIAPPVPSQTNAPPVAGYGGGSAPRSDVSSSSSSAAASAATLTVPLYVSAPADAAILGTTSVAFSGTTTPGYVVQISEGTDLASTTADSGGAWAITQDFASGTHSIAITAKNGSEATTTARTFTIDTAAPDTPSVTVKECQHAAVPCLVTTMRLTLLWDTVAHASYYEILKDGSAIATTTATTSAIVANSATTTKFAIVAHSYSEQEATSSNASVIVGSESDKNGNISTSETWDPSGNPYIITSSVTIPAGVTLTIEPGTIVKVKDVSPSAIQVSGTLMVGENGADGVVITSIKDDAALGDTNGDGTATLPATGDWTRIDVLSGGSLSMYNTELRYGGERVFNPTGFWESATIRNTDGEALLDHVTISHTVDAFVHAGTASSTVENSTVSDVSEYGVWAYGGGSASVLSSAITAVVPVYASGSALAISGNTFAPVSGTYAVQTSGGMFNNAGGNSGGGVIAIGALPENSATTLPADGLPYSFTSANPNVPASASLTISPGAVFKSNGQPIDIAGTLRVGSLGSDAVIFTSYHDDSALGHLAGIAASAAQSRDWQGITLESGSTATFANAQISYAGDCVTYSSFRDCASLRNLGGNLTLDHVKVVSGNDTGIGQGGGVTAATYLSFSDLSSATGISVRGGTFSVRQSAFTNLGAGLSANVPVDATQNWWGDASGPRNPTTNPSATGSYVSDSVTYDPWLVCDPVADASCTATNH